MRRTALVALLALGVTLGLSSLAGVGAAKPPATVETEEANQCTTTVETPTGDQVDVTHPCDVAETERCTFVVHDPFGMPQEVPYPCKVTVKKPTVSSTTTSPICWKVIHGPNGMPQLVPYPCALDG